MNLKVHSIFSIVSNKTVLLLFSILLCVSCTNKKQQIPTSIIDGKTMSHLIADIKTVDAAFQLGVAPREALESQMSIKTDTVNNTNVSSSNQAFKKVKEIIEQEIIEQEKTKSEYKPVTTSKRQYLGHIGADYEFVFKKHKVTRQQFEESINFYASNPDLFKPILEKSLEILTQYGVQNSNK